MNILFTGASGWIGRNLVLRLLRDGHAVRALERSADRARAALGAEVSLADYSDGSIRDAVEWADAVINLAGAPVLGARWSASRMKELYDSRVGVTRRLVDAIAAARDKPEVLLSASAIGYYGDRGDRAVDELARPGDGVLAELCRDWEAAAHAARASGVRVATLRVGVVLGRGGGALASMVRPFRVGLGGRVGSGRQFVSWIHLEDLLEVFATAASNQLYAGPINCVAPDPARNRDLARGIGAVLGRPAAVPAPELALRLLVGKGASVLTDSIRVRPAALTELGFRFRFPELDDALVDCLGDGGPRIALADRWPETPYLARRAPRYQLADRVLVDAPIDEVFRFFSAPENLGAITPPSMSFRIESPLPIDMREGAEIDYRIAVGPLPMRWRTRIQAWEPGARFVDSQERGPYRSWWHEHGFAADGDRTWVTDRVYYAPPLGVLGRIANAVLVRRQLAEIFAYRGAAIRFRFGEAAASRERLTA